MKIARCDMRNARGHDKHASIASGIDAHRRMRRE
ncbi:hypothetical protein A1SC_02190, partial [Escherichia sp. KTE52]